MTFNEYIRESTTYGLAYPEQRVGQAYFNVFRTHYPDLARAITNTDLDPFNIEKNLPKFLEFVAAVFDGKVWPSKT